MVREHERFQSHPKPHTNDHQSTTSPRSRPLGFRPVSVTPTSWSYYGYRVTKVGCLSTPRTGRVCETWVPEMIVTDGALVRVIQSEQGPVDTGLKTR